MPNVFHPVPLCCTRIRTDWNRAGFCGMDGWWLQGLLYHRWRHGKICKPKDTPARASVGSASGGFVAADRPKGTLPTAFRSASRGPAADQTRQAAQPIKAWRCCRAAAWKHSGCHARETWLTRNSGGERAHQCAVQKAGALSACADSLQANARFQPACSYAQLRKTSLQGTKRQCAQAWKLEEDLLTQLFMHRLGRVRWGGPCWRMGLTGVSTESGI
jgi:hypothetical protein